MIVLAMLQSLLCLFEGCVHTSYDLKKSNLPVMVISMHEFCFYLVLSLRFLITSQFNGDEWNHVHGA